MYRRGVALVLDAALHLMDETAQALHSKSQATGKLEATCRQLETSQWRSDLEVEKLRGLLDAAELMQERLSSQLQEPIRTELNGTQLEGTGSSDIFPKGSTETPTSRNTDLSADLVSAESSFSTQLLGPELERLGEVSRDLQRSSLESRYLVPLDSSKQSMAHDQELGEARMDDSARDAAVMSGFLSRQLTNTTIPAHVVSPATPSQTPSSFSDILQRLSHLEVSIQTNSPAEFTQVERI